MKNYKVGQIVRYTSKDFDGTVSTLAKIIEVSRDHAVAEELDQDPMKLWIDDDTDFMFESEDE